MYNSNQCVIMKLLQRKLLWKLTHMIESASIPVYFFFSDYVSNRITMLYNLEMMRLLGISFTEYKKICSEQFLFEYSGE